MLSLPLGFFRLPSRLFGRPFGECLVISFYLIRKTLLIPRLFCLVFSVDSRPSTKKESQNVGSFSNGRLVASGRRGFGLLNGAAL